MLRSAAVLVCTAASTIHDDLASFDDEAVSLLQLRSSEEESNNASATKNYWKDGGCAVQHEEPLYCAFNTDTHMSHRFAGGSSDLNQQGAQPLARTTDDSSSIDVFQTHYGTFNGVRSSQFSKVSAMAAKMGDHLIECQMPADCQMYTQCTVDGVDVTKGELPKRWPSGLYISRMSRGSVCIDSPDGKTSISFVMDARYMGYSNGGSAVNNFDENGMAKSCEAAVKGKIWFNGQVRMEKAIAVTGDNSLCGGPGVDVMPVASSLFTDDTKVGLCNLATYKSTNPGATAVIPDDCDDFPPPDMPPPTAEESCIENGCAFDKAQEYCEPLQNHDFKFQGCLVDVCAECAGNDEMKDIAEEDIIEEEEAEPGPICVESGDSCGLPTDTCQKSVEVSLDTVIQNNLAGAGPDAGEPGIRFSRAAIVGGRVIDVVLKAVGGTYAGKVNKNGKKGEFGVVSLKSGRTVDLEYSFVDSESGESVSLDAVALSFYDLDEGKKGSSRTTLTACGATNAIITTNTELTVDRPNQCYAVSSSLHGTAANNPSSPGTLSEDQGARSVTVSYESVSSIQVTVAMGKGWGSRNLFWSFQPSIACLAGEASDMPLRLLEKVDMSVPSYQTCPIFHHAEFVDDLGRSAHKNLVSGSGSSSQACFANCKASYGDKLTGIQGKVSSKSIVGFGPSNSMSQCKCGIGVPGTHSHDLFFGFMCPPSNWFCNIDLWEECYEMFKQTELNGKPWDWNDMI